MDGFSVTMTKETEGTVESYSFTHVATGQVRVENWVDDELLTRRQYSSESALSLQNRLKSVGFKS